MTLCQPGKGKSCAACCGIYNYTDSSPASLSERLGRRTELFHKLGGITQDLELFGRIVAHKEDQRRRFAQIHCCPFVGFLDRQERKVGCLLHPGQNGGADRRAASFYGGTLCRDHLCPSHHFLTQLEQEVLIEVIDDWYLYGLCVTDIDLVKGYLCRVADRLGWTPKAEMFCVPAVRKAARHFFGFKMDWPFRSNQTNRFGRFYFDGSQYMIRPIDYASLGCERSSYDGIFLSLSSEFRGQKELRQAEALIEEGICRTAAALESLDFR